jgi:hypothetical protein
MIQANELRIGNLVADDTGRIGNVVEFTEKSIRIKMQFSNVKIDSGRGFVGLDVEPVHLTKNILEKCAISISQVSVSFRIDLPGRVEKLFLTLKEVGNAKPFVLTIFSFGMSAKLIDCYHLHQLQNIYFYLTGEELNVEGITSSLFEKPKCGVGENIT